VCSAIGADRADYTISLLLFLWRCLVSSVLLLFVSLSLPINGSICHNIIILSCNHVGKLCLFSCTYDKVPDGRNIIHSSFCERMSHNGTIRWKERKNISFLRRYPVWTSAEDPTILTGLLYSFTRFLYVPSHRPYVCLFVFTASCTCHLRLNSILFEAI
jgi:hypothetical protein